MAGLEELLDILIIRLDEWADMPGSTPEISDEQIWALMKNKTGPAKVDSLISKLVNIEMLIKTDKINPSIYTFTDKLFRDATNIRKDTPVKSSKAVNFSRIQEDLLMSLVDQEKNIGPGIHDLKGTADQAELQYQPGWVRKAAYDFRDRGLIREPRIARQSAAMSATASSARFVGLVIFVGRFSA